jgi:hypothetical protein
MSVPNQTEADDAEWSSPANWAGLGPCKAYFSKRDSRVFVPMRWKGSLGPRTLNFGHRLGFPVFVFMYTSVASILLAAAWSKMR